MNRSSEANYFKIGSFVLVGLGLVIFAVLIFGSSKIFEPVVYLETYFDESIQGISEGTPVKYRGLQVGYIEDITFTDEVYNNIMENSSKNRSIYVKIAITSKLFTRLTKAKLKEFLTREVENGLRVKLVAQGLTGTSHLEFNYVEVPSNPPAAISWQPKNFYVPASKSTLTRLSENAQYIMNELKKVDFNKLFNGINQMTYAFSQTASKTAASINQINEPLETILQNFKVVSDNLKVITEQLKLNPSSMVFGKQPPPIEPSKL